MVALDRTTLSTAVTARFSIDTPQNEHHTLLQQASARACWISARLGIFQRAFRWASLLHTIPPSNPHFPNRTFFVLERRYTQQKTNIESNWKTRHGNKYRIKV
uniref:Uncharacterized protein n=1 Tax=Mucochytrium quahogii TaxID=96639 RepID=A0A7S2SJF2_9STRA